jgi:tRNA-Thr(GGU) m(6)t(6)A37 methyltransferase TsaA
MRMTVKFKTIGVIHTPYSDPEGIPIQGALRTEIEGRAEIFPEYEEGLRDVEGFSHLIFLYHFHRVKEYALVSRPFLDDTPRGVFSIRSPRRPNPIGMTVVRLLRREKNMLFFGGVDMVDGTPLLDIKPYIPDVDAHDADRVGWLGDKMRKEGKEKCANGRFRE